jgi:formate dehydrogenase major subunit
MSLVARRLTEMKEEHGPDSIGVIASSKCTNEDGFLMQKFARAVIGTNNTDNCSRYCQSPATQGLFRTVGHGGDSGSIADIEKADLVIIIGSNTSEAHPVLATRVKRAHKLRGQRLIVSDLREHEMARRADIFLRPEPSTDLIWLSAISRYLLDNGLAQTEFLNTWVNDLDKYRASLEPFTMEFAEERCKVSKETLIEIAHEIARSNATCILWAMGITQHCSGSDNSTAISNLLLISGNYMRPGTGAYPLRGHNNVQGASDMGAMPTYLVGYDKVSDDEARARYEKTWGIKMPTARGLDNHEMVDAVYDGKLKAVYLAGEDMVSADSDANRVAGAFERLDFFVVQDIFFTETCRYADVVFPAAPALEKDGTFTSTERRIQRLYKVFDPIGESKADWQITTELANRMGAGWTYKHPADIMAEIASLSSIFAGVTYDRLAGFQSLQWPVAIDGTDQPLLYTKHFHFPDGKARLYPLEWNEPCEQQDEQYDIHLNNGRLMEHFHEGNMTYRVKGIKEETPDRFLEVSPELAKERGILNGTWVDVISRTGKIRVQALVTDRVEGKQVYLPLTSSEGPVNVLTGSKVDKDVHTPAYKETAVKIEVLPFHGDNPLKPLNFRYSGKPTPQAGVEVERKWKRSDYRIPGQPPSLVQIHTSNGHGSNGHAR